MLRDDPLETNLERALNFGHTLAHPLETIDNYQGLSHGESVGIGMAAATRFAVRNGYCSLDTGRRIVKVVERAGLPTRITAARNYDILRALEAIIRVRDGSLNLVLPVEIGKTVIVKQVEIMELVDCLSAL